MLLTWILINVWSWTLEILLFFWGEITRINDWFETLEGCSMSSDLRSNFSVVEGIEMELRLEHREGWVRSGEIEVHFALSGCD